MRPARLGALVGVCALVLTGCSGEQEPKIALPTLSIAPTSPTSPAVTDARPDSPAPQSGEGTSRDVAELVRRVESAGSVRLEVGNLNPPPTQLLVQDFSVPEGDLEASFSTYDPEEPVLVARRVDGELSVSTEGGPFRPVPPLEPDQDGGLLGRYLATDPATELEVLLGGAGSVDPAPDLVGEVQGAAAAYRLLVATDDLPPPGTDAFASIPWLGLPERLPVSLWLGADGLPLRIEAKYRDPLNGIEGTGTARIDYSAWGEAVQLTAPE